MNYSNSQPSHTTSGTPYPMDIEKLLRDGHPVRLKPQGFSMYPLFISGRDEAVIAPCDPASLHRGDVALYRRDNSILVLHRIWKVRDDGFYMVGDNQTEIEGPLRPEFSTSNMLYRLLSGIWLFCRPLRPLAHKIANLLRRFRRKR